MQKFGFFARGSAAACESGVTFGAFHATGAVVNIAPQSRIEARAR